MTSYFNASLGSERDSLLDGDMSARAACPELGNCTRKAPFTSARLATDILSLSDTSLELAVLLVSTRSGGGVSCSWHVASAVKHPTGVVNSKVTEVAFCDAATTASDGVHVADAFIVAFSQTFMLTANVCILYKHSASQND